MMDGEQGPALTTSHGIVEPRAGHADREAVAEQLRVAAGEGRIDLAELEERIDRAYAAKTFGELDVLVADLLQERPSGSRPGTDAEPLVLKTSLSNIKQNGRWTVPRRITAECKMLSIVIDFTEATCVHRDVTVEARCGTGSIQLIVPQGWAVRVDGASTNTAHISNKATAPADPTSPTLTIVGHPRAGRIKIKQPRRRR
ncbi:hypothetical protein SSP35_20_00630 [Streptomyces sp. NBRC 110611]|uniref:DUF1707 SHOCT-like domain-containing protein n=1 Tax=Streptomyces sp. NBRC 110611 TaxID=1621259 RepID=UPI000858DD1D|nr:DUF1707 domain-containing protein [Streptomyces sp. NBRC 110611]GAU70567.1 hypothetical protein SSP35_20_00630 [Streptomyces sp. NBRC 110611]